MFEGHDPYLVALSVVVAILGGYTGFGLAARIRGTPGVSRRVLLAGAAAFLAIGIWTMHFVGMLAESIPADAVYLVLPTIISFLICALVVGISLFFVSVGEPSLLRVVSSAVLLGAGIASMHYVGIHGLAGNFAIEHDGTMVVLSVVVAIVAAYGGLRAFLARQEGIRLIASSIAFGVAVSGMHYTAMSGMHFVPLSDGSHHHHWEGLAASQQVLSLVVTLCCFVIAAGFLLSLVPDPRRKVGTSSIDAAGFAGGTTGPQAQVPSAEAGMAASVSAAEGGRRSAALASPAPCPLRGFRSRAPTARTSSTPPMCAASAPMPIIPRSMTAPASGCVHGRSRKPKRNSIPGCSSGCTAATSWQSRM